MRKKVRRLLHGALGLVVAGLFLYLSLRKVDLGEFWVRLRSVDLRYLLPFLLLLALFFWLKAWRWSCLLRPLRREQPLSTRQVLPALMIGFMSNNVLPAHLGEIIRVFVLGKQFSLSKTSVLSTVVLERVLDFLAIVGTFAITLQFVPISEDLRVVRTGGYFIGGACLLVLFAFLALVWQTERTLRLFEALLRILPRRVREKALEIVRSGVEGLHSLRSPRLLIVLLALTVVHWSVHGVGVYLITLSFPGSDVPALAGFFLMSVSALGVTLPSAPGYVGTIQLCFVIALSAFAVEKETALAASVYYLALIYIPVTLAGFYYLASRGLRLGKLSRESEEPEA